MKRKIILTPECNKLWIVNPSLFFNYDCVVMDDRDYHKLLNPRQDTLLTQTISKTVLQLKKFDLIQLINYEQYFDDNIKKSVHTHAEKLVQDIISEIGSNLESSKFYKYSLYTHVEFANYLKQFIMECSVENKEEFTRYSNRYKRVIERMNLIKSGKISDEVFEQLSEALVRITAKVLAGIYISKKAEVPVLYDTKEYIPFISSTLHKDIEDLKFKSSDEDPFYNLVVKSLTEWETPTIKDKVHFFNVIEETYDFEKLKNALKQVEDFYDDIIKVDPDLVTKNLKKEFCRVEQEYKNEVKNIKEKFSGKAVWHIIDMVVGQYLGFLSPWITDAKEHKEEKINEFVNSKLLQKKDLNSQLFYISELWNKVEPQALQKKLNSIKKCDKIEEIWGENNDNLPWYEKK